MIGDECSLVFCQCFPKPFPNVSIRDSFKLIPHSTKMPKNLPTKSLHNNELKATIIQQGRTHLKSGSHTGPANHFLVGSLV